MKEVALSPLSVGEIVAGKYRIDGVLGKGGMATVFSAWHTELQQRVALKMLHGGIGADPTMVERFIREARNAARIQSEHVARIMELGRVTSDRVFIVMECLEGHDLSEVLRTRGALPPGEVVEYLVQACEAIAIAHSLGIVHRDLKPANLFLTRRVDGTPCVKVLDFGIAKVFDSPQPNELTTTTAIVGSPLYMAPEQMTNARDVDPRADIWSLGIIAYRLLTKQLPFTGDTFVELAMNVASQRPRPMSEIEPRIPLELEAAIMRCLERDRDRRWADVGAFVAAIAPFGPPHLAPVVDRVLRIAAANRGLPRPPESNGGSGVFEVPFPSLPEPPTAQTLASIATLDAPSRVSTRRRGMTLWSALAATMVGMILMITAFNRSAHEATASSATAQPSAPTSPNPTAVPSASSPAVVASAAPLPSQTASAAPVQTIKPSGKPLPTAVPTVAKAATPLPKKPPKSDVWGWGE